MRKRLRRNHTPGFKAKVVLAAISRARLPVLKHFRDLLAAINTPAPINDGHLPRQRQAIYEGARTTLTSIWRASCSR